MARQGSRAAERGGEPSFRSPAEIRSRTGVLPESAGYPGRQTGEEYAGKLVAALSLWPAAFSITIGYVWFVGRGVGVGRLLSVFLASFGIPITGFSSSNRLSLSLSLHSTITNHTGTVARGLIAHLVASNALPPALAAGASTTLRWQPFGLLAPGSAEADPAHGGRRRRA